MSNNDNEVIQESESQMELEQALGQELFRTAGSNSITSSISSSSNNQLVNYFNGKGGSRYIKF